VLKKDSKERKGLFPKIQVGIRMLVNSAKNLSDVSSSVSHFSAVNWIKTTRGSSGKLQ